MPNYSPYQSYMPQQPIMPMMRQPTYASVDQNYPVIKGRPVSSFEEARASMIDFDGSVFYFPDLANQKIYTKQINMDGTPAIKIYELAQTPIAPPATSVAAENLVTKEEFEKTVNGLLQQIESLKSHIPTPQVEASPSPAPVPADFKF